VSCAQDDTLIGYIWFPGEIPPSMFRAVNGDKGCYPNPTGSETAHCIPLAEPIVKGSFQDFQEKLHRDVFRSIPGTSTFEKTLGTLSPLRHPPRLREWNCHREKMAEQYGTSVYNKTIEIWEPARAISENEPIHRPNRANCSPKAYGNLQQVSNNWTVRKKSKDAWEETPWIQRSNAEFRHTGDANVRCSEKCAFPM
jgi:hypothetical protein